MLFPLYGVLFALIIGKKKSAFFNIFIYWQVFESEIHCLVDKYYALPFDTIVNLTCPKGDLWTVIANRQE